MSRLCHVWATAAAVAGVIGAGTAIAADSARHVKNLQAVQEVRSGKRTVADACWWGFDPDDATDALQAAIDSGAKTVIVPDLGKDWNVRPIRLAGNQELVLEKGVVVAAKRGEYRRGSDSVFTASNVDNVAIRGTGAVVRMQKEDYIVGTVLEQLGWERWFGPYSKAEWRMCLAIRGCAHVRVEGLTLADSGGDGIYIDGGKKSGCSRDVLLKNVVCDNNYRQGLSVISVDGLLAEDCIFRNTWGTPPSSGVDLEPDSPDQKIVGIVFRRCAFVDNYGDGIEVFLPHQAPRSAPISVLFENCRVASRRGPAIRVAKIFDDGPTGQVEFRNCQVDGSEGYAIKVQDKSPQSARVRFVGCTIRDAARNRNYRDTWAPVVLAARKGKRIARFGGIDFIDCRVEDRLERPAVVVSGDAELVDVGGSIAVDSPHAVKIDAGARQPAIGIRVERAKR